MIKKALIVSGVVLGGVACGGGSDDKKSDACGAYCDAACDKASVCFIIPSTEIAANECETECIEGIPRFEDATGGQATAERCDMLKGHIQGLSCGEFTNLLADTLDTLLSREIPENYNTSNEISMGAEVGKELGKLK